MVVINCKNERLVYVTADMEKACVREGRYGIDCDLVRLTMLKRYTSRYFVHQLLGCKNELHRIRRKRNKGFGPVYTPRYKGLVCVHHSQMNYRAVAEFQ